MSAWLDYITKPAREVKPVSPNLDVSAELRTHCLPVLKGTLERLANAQRGSRNNETNLAAYKVGQYVARGVLSEEQAYQVIDNACESWLTGDAAVADRDLTARTIISGMTAGLAHPKEPWPPAGYNTEADFWKSRPIFEHIHQFARAQQAPPMSTLACVLARVLVSVSPMVRIPAVRASSASLNMLFALVGEPGGGKGSSVGCSQDCFIIHNPLADEDEAREAPPLPVGSGEGIAKAFMHMVPKVAATANTPAIPAHMEQYRSRILMVANEIETLGAVKGRGNSTLSLTFRCAFSGEVLGAQNAHDETTNIVQAHKYRLCLVVGVQPDAASILLEEESLGTPQRFLWVSAVDPDAPDNPPDAPEPITWEPPEYGAVGQPGAVDWGGPTDSRFMQMIVCDVARTDIRRVGLAAVRGESKGSEGHIMLLRLKTATALALLDGRWNVNDEDWQLAGYLMEHSERVKKGLKDRAFALKVKQNEVRGRAEASREVMKVESIETAAVYKVSEKVKKKLLQPMSRTDLSRAMTSQKDRNLLDDALEFLKEKEVIEEYEEREADKGKASKFYRLI